ncbi:MAG: type VI secretion system ATPase TssH, partial [Spirochaetota bacterium]
PFTGYISAIVKNHVAEVALRLKDRGVILQITPAALEFLSREGYDPAFGARPLKRAIQKYILNPLSIKILSGEHSEGAAMKIDYKNDEIIFVAGKK